LKLPHLSSQDPAARRSCNCSTTKLTPPTDYINFFIVTDFMADESQRISLSTDASFDAAVITTKNHNAEEKQASIILLTFMMFILCSTLLLSPSVEQFVPNLSFSSASCPTHWS
jgi:hypothetical protein